MRAPLLAPVAALVGLLAGVAAAGPPDKPVPPADWVAKLKPEVNPDLKDLPDNTWRLLKPAGDTFDHPKTEVGLVYDEKVGGVVYFAGCSAGYCNSVWLYHVGSNTWREVLPWVKGREEDTGKPIGQCGYYAAYNSDLGLYFKHRAVSSTADGRGGRGRDSNTWALDGRALKWERLAAGPHDAAGPDWPGAYCCYGLVSDRDAKRALMYGGMGDEGSTWAFDFEKKTWANRKPKASPPPLFLHSMVYDSVNKVTLLFGGQTGGYSAGKTLSETWAYRWDDNTWEKRSPRTAPPPRAQAQACFDSVNGVMILFGGHSEVYPKRSEGRWYMDTWVYDYRADTWTEMKPKDGPDGSSVRFMAFDPVNDVAINVNGAGPKKQTWVYRYKRCDGGKR